MHQDSQVDTLLVLLRGLQNAAGPEESGEREFRARLAVLESSFREKGNVKQIEEAAVSLLAKRHQQLNESVTRLKSELATERAKALPALQNANGSIAQQLAAPAEPAPADSASSGYVRDPLTGLPARAYSEAELAHAFETGAECFMAIFVVKRLALINAKFGFARGDQVLLKVVSHLAQALPEFQEFFRWSPCAFIAVAPTGISFRELRSKVQVIELTRITPTLEWQGHNAMVPVALDCRVLSVKDFATVPELFLRLDTFASDV